ncbi:hypothetical protein [Zobellia barbeyronii]|uniref:Uncharacterized protein n=1 Tax=Zobellia barbeyronii TaxID=2748009 RepID=A0ABS5W8H2_9FLAO|nr:hypothetical protein [Zobellia barbeyronii]MBT2159739.1 hypothetical protein [Zobellia barbeyronii]
MELDYKNYRKVKIYFNKVCRALTNLEKLQERSSLSFGNALLVSRVQEMQLVQAQLVSFFIDPNLKLPYVPASRCKALTTWYMDDKLFSCRSLSSFNAMLIKEDEKALKEVGYITDDLLLSSALKTLFEEHRERLKKLRITKDILNEL